MCVLYIRWCSSSTELLTQLIPSCSWFQVSRSFPACCFTVSRYSKYLYTTKTALSSSDRYEQGDRCTDRQVYLCGRVWSTSQSPADGLTKEELNCCKFPASKAWLTRATADSISTATNSSSCCSSPWWRHQESTEILKFITNKSTQVNLLKWQEVKKSPDEN